MEEEENQFHRWSWCQHEWNDQTQKNVLWTLALLKKIIIYCRENGVKLMITGVPHYQQFAIDNQGRRIWSARPHQEIEKLARGEQVPYLNSWKALEPIISSTRQTKYYYKNNMHFNPRGYKIWAQVHIQTLMDRKSDLIPATVY
ncbi:MAG: SGNH/GDSL hydrolase family protein [Candidatus Auribacterota bacterium]|nr:SGNH/GDSL hydrolase family protein [Candidatus Auribacterota bacterium]